MSSVTVCSTEGHEKTPAAETHPVNGKERPFCQVCSERWKAQRREET